MVPSCPYELTQEQHNDVENITQAYPADKNGTVAYFALREYFKSIFS